jgi:hypothetical protein
MSKNTVQFKFKEKGKKPVSTSGVHQFMISGADMNVDMMGEILQQ